MFHISGHHRCCMSSKKFSFNLYHSLGEFSRQQTDDILLIFPRKQDLTFHANCLQRKGDNLHEISNPISWEKGEKYFKMSYSENFTQSAKR